uniref:Nickel/cobalt efflux system n=1 Tax=Octactis speculum TaxID=3111310 RepID=A0A7S2H605_9STRA
MYPIGFLFGLGFDTATEVGLLVVVAQGSGAPPLLLMLPPLLFSATMSVVDSLDGMLMLWAYGASLDHPRSRQVFSLFLTSASAIIALLIGTMEALGYLQHQFFPVQDSSSGGGFWGCVAFLQNHSEVVGLCIVAFFLITTTVALTFFGRHVARTTQETVMQTQDALRFRDEAIELRDCVVSVARQQRASSSDDGGRKKVTRPGKLVGSAVHLTKLSGALASLNGEPGMVTRYHASTMKYVVELDGSVVSSCRFIKAMESNLLS